MQTYLRLLGGVFVIVVLGLAVHGTNSFSVSGWFPDVIGVASAKPAKNLKVLPAGMDKKKLKPIMKQFAKALGVECSFCHDTSAGFDADTKEKKITRDMMRMVNAMNSKYLKKYKAKVSCNTCHQGSKKTKR